MKPPSVLKHSHTPGDNIFDSARKNSDGSRKKVQSNPQSSSASEPLGTAMINMTTLQQIIHEIRSPLTAISLANECISDGSTAAPSVHVLTEIVAKNVWKIEEVLVELFQPQRNLQYKMSPIDVCDVIEKSLHSASDQIFLKKIKVVKSYAFGLVVNGNAEKLATAFLNIIVNAIEAMGNRGKLWVTSYRAKDSVKVIFKDNGHGIDGSQAAHIFERRFTGKIGGLGTGLASVKDILQRHDAEISVNSEKGTGTTMVVCFHAS